MPLSMLSMAPSKPVDMPSMPFSTESRIGLILRATLISGVSNMPVNTVAMALTPSIIAIWNLDERMSNCELMIV